MECPQCRHGFRPVEYEGMTIHTCDGCGGEFIDPEALAHIVQCRKQRFDASVMAECAQTSPTFGVPAAELGRELCCPACAEPMAVLNFANDTGVCVDRCPACGGIWLDHMELEKVQTLLERWSDEAPQQIQAIAADLERTRREAANRINNAFSGSRFAFVNALINRILDAA